MLQDEDEHMTCKCGMINITCLLLAMHPPWREGRTLSRWLRRSCPKSRKCNIISQKGCFPRNLFRAAKDGSKVGVDCCIGHQYVQTSPPSLRCLTSEAPTLVSNHYLLTVDSNKALLSDDFPTWQTWSRSLWPQWWWWSWGSWWWYESYHMMMIILHSPFRRRQAPQTSAAPQPFQH